MSTAHLSRFLAPVLLVAMVALVGPSAASPQAPGAKRQATQVAGWTSAPDSVAAGSTYVAQVRVSGRRRAVHLQRLHGDTWRTVEVTRTGAKGVATLRWTALLRPATVVLRVRVLRNPRHTAAVTPGRIVRISKAAAPGTPTGPTSPSVPTDDTGSVDPLDPSDGSEQVSNPALREVLTLVNRARATGHTCDGVPIGPVPALSADTRLGRAADAFAVAMATQGFFSHTGPDGSDPGDRITAQGYPWTTYGEAISAGRTEPAGVVDGWLASPGHCRILMSGSYAEVGLGQAVDAGSTYGTYWVLVAAHR